MNRASAIRRILAGIIDMLILYFLVQLTSQHLGSGFIFLSGLVFIVYKPLAEKYYGRTWGKLFLKIKVETELKKKQKSLTWKQTILRNSFFLGVAISSYAFNIHYHSTGMNWLDIKDVPSSVFWQAAISLCFYFSYFISFIVLIFSKEKMALHDLFSNTFVSKVDIP